ncbi:hypothetical protein [Microcoleus vaginatus]|uniref:hypothetical protein n=1 Tax=Microcoleus vaginatus TaxID=119532 RepID=UPI001F619981
MTLFLGEIIRKVPRVLCWHPGTNKSGKVVAQASKSIAPGSRFAWAIASRTANAAIWLLEYSVCCCLSIA